MNLITIHKKETLDKRIYILKIKNGPVPNIKYRSSVYSLISESVKFID